MVVIAALGAGAAFGWPTLAQQWRQWVNNNSSSASTIVAAPPSKPAFTSPPVAISAGIVQRPGGEAVAPLGIQTSPGADYFVKLVDPVGRTVMSLYVEGGRRFETLVPLGTYEMRYASGQTWYGPIHLFGPNTVYAKAQTAFNFRIEGNQYAGYTVELIRQVGGNLRTSSISASEF